MATDEPGGGFPFRIGDAVVAVTDRGEEVQGRVADVYDSGDVLVVFDEDADWDHTGPDRAVFSSRQIRKP